MAEKRYTVLMSVYAGEKAENLRQSIESMISQTLLPFECIVVCDGPLGEALEDVLQEYEGRIRTVRLRQNAGLGPALREGMKECRTELVLRMDSDDVALPERAEKQMAFMCAHPEIDVISCAVKEFCGDTEQISAVRTLPEDDESIRVFAKKRNPMNHPAVCFRKSAVEKCGGYEPVPYYEDYDLWIRMLMNGCRMANMAEPLLLMRSDSDFYERRGGRRYLSCTRDFLRRARDIGFLTRREYYKSLFVRGAVNMMPNCLRKVFYKKFLRR